jgi:hypothetical protein
MVSLEVSAVARKAQHALATSHLIALRRLRVAEQDDRLFISGRVATFYQKQQAQEIVRSAAQGMLVVNEIEVS